MVDPADLESAERLFRTLAEWVADQLDLDVYPDQVWRPHMGASASLERFIRREVLDKTAAPIVWAMDEVDRLFPYSYSSQVFGLFRSWHNRRGLDPDAPWSRLTLAIAYATEVHLFITDLNQSPFNVGTRLTLEEFTPEQVADLNGRYGSPLRDETEIRRYCELLSGHPFLVSRGLYEMVTRGLDIAAFEAQADRDEGMFGDHLRRLLVLLVNQPEWCEAVRAVLGGGSCPTDESFYRLRSAGILAGDSARTARLRCGLYAAYLQRHLQPLH
jgi:AAA-like domain